MTSPCHSQRKELSNQVGGRPLALHTHTVLVLASFMASLGKAITFWSLRLAPNRERPLGKPVVMLSERLRRYRFFRGRATNWKVNGLSPRDHRLLGLKNGPIRRADQPITPIGRWPRPRPMVRGRGQRPFLCQTTCNLRTMWRQIGASAATADHFQDAGKLPLLGASRK